MYLKVKHDIENNVFISEITVDSFGTSNLSVCEEKEMLQDFPSHITYRTLDFARNVKMTGSIPEVTEDEVGSGVVLVKLPALSNQEILIDQNFKATYKCDLCRIPQSAVDEEVLTTKELVAQAYCVVFDAVICDEVKRIMDEIRTKAPAFSGEDIIDI